MSFDHQTFLKNTPTGPGVYRMFASHSNQAEQADKTDQAGETNQKEKPDQIIYIGKARNLQNRLRSYFSGTQVIKTRKLVEQIAYIETTLTHTEAEALILEHNLIKEFKPRYNILLRDDKSYPHIHVSEHVFPRLSSHRGLKSKKGKYYGPYPSTGAVRHANQFLQKLFKIRTCEDSEFANRSRPCLQHQINRCKAPCVDLVSQEEYAQDMRHVSLFLDGKSEDIMNELIQQMDQASENLEFETAAELRDQISALRTVVQKQFVSGVKGNVDIVSVYYAAGIAVVELMFIRAGRVLGNKSFNPKIPDETSEEEILSAFLLQFYLKHDIPQEIITSIPVEDAEVLAELFTERSGHNVSIANNVRSERLRWQQLAQDNAQQSHKRLSSSKASHVQRIEQLQALLQLEDAPERMECFDISHTMGEETVASCVVFNNEGALKSDYRRFNIRDITGGDDYAAMNQALERRYKRILKESAVLPDIIFIDGGKGQVSQALEVLKELQVDSICVVGVAKGPERIAGEETLIIPHLNAEINLESDSPALHLIQQIRDEAHRFAITGHRAKRGKKRTRSVLEDIEGLGPKRRQSLLKAFGGLQGIKEASIEEMTKVTGISKKLAQLIYSELH